MTLTLKMYITDLDRYI